MCEQHLQTWCCIAGSASHLPGWSAALHVLTIRLSAVQSPGPPAPDPLRHPPQTTTPPALLARSEMMVQWVS